MLSYIQNYAPFIQLAVAFNFAFVAFGSAETEQKIINKLGAPFKQKQKKLCEYIEKTKNELNEYANSVYTNTLQREIYTKHKIEYKQKAEQAKDVIEKIQKLHPYYMGPVSMIIGIYSIIELLLLAEIETNGTSQSLFIFLTIIISAIIGCYLYLEYKKNKTIWKSCKMQKVLEDIENEEKEYIRPLILSLTTLFLFFILRSFFPEIGEHIVNLFCFEKTFRYTLVVPYITFIVCFIFFFLSITASSICKYYVVLCRYYYRLKCQFVWWLLKAFMPKEGKYGDIKMEQATTLDNIYSPNTATTDKIDKKEEIKKLLTPKQTSSVNKKRNNKRKK